MWKLISIALLIFLGGIHSAIAQDVNDFVRLFSGLAQSAIDRQAAKQAP